VVRRKTATTRMRRRAETAGSRGPGLTRSDVVSPGLTWSDVVSPGLTWSDVVSPGLTWSDVVSPGLVPQVLLLPPVLRGAARPAGLPLRQEAPRSCFL